MALQKQPVEVNFGLGLDTKTSASDVQMGKMLALSNAEFSAMGELRKRAGFDRLTTSPDAFTTQLTTYQSNLIATGTNLSTFSASTNAWMTKGTVQPIDLRVQPLVRNSYSQTDIDSAQASNGLVCVVYNENGTNYYSITNGATGQQIVNKGALEADATNPLVRQLGAYFVIVYKKTITANVHLRYITIPTAVPTSTSTPADLAISLLAIDTPIDAFVMSNRLFYAYSSGLGGGTIRLGYLTNTLINSAQSVIAGHTGSLLALSGDTSSLNVFISWFESGTLYTAVRGFGLGAIVAPVSVATGLTLARLTSIAAAGTATLIAEVSNTYTYSSAKTDYLRKYTVTAAGVAASAGIILRGVGIASKLFAVSGTNYILCFYGSDSQPSYFVITDSGTIVSRLAYSNGITYALAPIVLPSVLVNGTAASFPYLIRTQLQAVNKDVDAPNVNGIYSQTGINLATLDINSTSQYSAEIASSLHLTGGQLWQFDGVKPVEHGFHVWPDDIEGTTVAAGGDITAQQYYYIHVYEWTDGAGILHRSAPSIPTGILAAGANSTNTLTVPTLRLTAKTGSNPVRIVGYRWSTAQQEYYQYTSITAPTLNDTSVDYVTIVDTQADSAILGNTLLYTTGGVLENIAAPASNGICLWNNRLWLIDAEDRNTLWFSKIVLPGTPVEMTDIQTYYVAPTSGAQGSTGEITAISSMDDKLIIFKKDAIYYVTGTPPDAAGANSQLSDPVFITGAVGCDNSDSIVLTPNGLMFQSDKGIWLLGRNLASSYVGADVEQYNSEIVTSAVCIPGTNQVRMGLSTGTVLMYDYYYSQWGTFAGLDAISGCLYDGAHTILNSNQVVLKQGARFQDDGKPVLMSFTTAWIKLAGIQGYQRAYFVYLLSNYLTPHKLAVTMAYDYDSNGVQTAVIQPSNFSDVYGADSPYGTGSPYGGQPQIEQWRIFFNRQKCEAIQITMQETYDSSKGESAGAGLVFNGLNFVVGVKKGYNVLPPANSVS